MNPQVIQLENGLRLIFEHTPHRRNVDIIITFTVGTRNEEEDEHGIAHFLEHLLFKNNHKKRNIPLEIDKLGGEIDAFTTREGTYFSLKILKYNISKGLNLLSEIILNPQFTEKDVELEKKVVKEEIKMYKDSPEEIALDLFIKNSLNGHPLSREILGTESSIESFTLEKIMNFYEKKYVPQKAIIAINGDLPLDEIIKLVERNFSSKFKNLKSCEEKYFPPKFIPQRVVINEDFEQVQFIWGTEGYKPQDRRKFSLYLLSLILGGGISSRLFQELREKNGLVYSVEAQGVNFSDISLFTIYTATIPKFLPKTLSHLSKEIEKLKKNGIKKEELEVAKRQSIYSFLMNIESSKFRLFYYLDSIILYGKIVPYLETIRNIRRISLTDIQETISYIFNNPVSLTVLGPVNPKLKNSLERGEMI